MLFKLIILSLIITNSNSICDNFCNKDINNLDFDIQPSKRNINSYNYCYKIDNNLNYNIYTDDKLCYFFCDNFNKIAFIFNDKKYKIDSINITPNYFNKSLCYKVDIEKYLKLENNKCYYLNQIYIPTTQETTTQQETTTGQITVIPTTTFSPIITQTTTVDPINLNNNISQSESITNSENTGYMLLIFLLLLIIIVFILLYLLFKQANKISKLSNQISVSRERRETVESILYDRINDNSNHQRKIEYTPIDEYNELSPQMEESIEYDTRPIKRPPRRSTYF
jgi:phage FluMu protein Com